MRWRRVPGFSRWASAANSIPVRCARATGASRPSKTRCTNAICCAGSKSWSGKSANWSVAVAEYRIEQHEGRVGELLVRQDRGRVLRDLIRYADDPVAFCVEVLGGQPWSTQRDVMTCVRDHALV